VRSAAANLRFRSQVYLFLIIDKPRVSPDQWVYFPDKEIPFGRISEMKNFSPRMSPVDKTSLFIEFFCWEDDEIWRASKDELLEMAVGWLDRLGFVKRREVLECHFHRERSVYPVYDLAYREHLTVVMEYLDRFANLLYIGRPGRFKYTNQDHSLEMGFAAARTIVEGNRFDLDAAGAEQEYFEAGRAT
jgi:protoporphyrinogen oxidase